LSTISVLIQRTENGRDIQLPKYATSGAAGMDLCAAILDNVTLQPGERALIPTGLRMSIPAGYEGQVRGRSGNAIKRGIGLVNAPGTIDSDYRGEISVILINWGREQQTIKRGERIAQLVISPIVRAELCEVSDLGESSRGEGGFGHSGT
jgi:dUTP pyrophosphatase